jgi:hypothetical protein
VGAVAWQRAEGGLVFLAAAALVWLWGIELPWWAVLLLFFAPDLSFAGYLAGPRAGAAIYNLVHLYAFGALLLAAGALLAVPFVSTLGLLWLGHAGFDRMMGYGLKLPSGFADTHLGRIGRARGA